MIAARLAWRLLRAGGRRDAVTVVLSIIGSAVAAMLLVLIVGAWSGVDSRAERAQWRSPQAADTTTAAALQRTTTSAYHGEELVLIDLAATSNKPQPRPPGMNAFPEPGQTYLSPALAELVKKNPKDLGQRFPRATGLLEKPALLHPDELVAVHGRDKHAAAMTAPRWQDQRRPDAYSGPVPIDSFTGVAIPDGQGAQYKSLASVAAVLLLIPLGVLAGAAARLGLARREQRFAALRLAGASPWQVLQMAAVEAAVMAAAGTVVGTGAGLLLVPLAANVPVGGGRWFPSDLVPTLPVLLATAAAVIGIAVASSAVTLRRVVSNPLGVAARHTPRRMSAIRVLIFTALIAGFVQYSKSANASTTALVLVFGAVFAALTVIGPWVIGVLGQVVVHRSRTSAALLAGRRMLDDPRGAWRVVGSVAMTGFVAGTLVLFPAGKTDLVWGHADQINVAVPAGSAGTVTTTLRAELARDHIKATVSAGEDRGALLFLRIEEFEAAFLTVTVSDPNADLEAARSAVARVAPGSVAATGKDIVLGEDQFITDFRTASVLVLALSFLVATTSAGITAAASVLDRRRTYRQLVLIGVPLSVLDRARSLETQIPLLLMAVGSTATGVVVAAPLTQLGLSGGSLDLDGVLALFGCLAVGVLGVRTATAASRPLLAKVANDDRSIPA
jgi:hypothetical protein